MTGQAEDRSLGSALLVTPAAAATPVLPAPPALAYLTSQYPMLSMTFILREIAQLRRAGFRIDAASINRPDRAVDAMTSEEREEAAATYCVKADGVGAAALAHGAALLSHLRGYLRGWALVRRLSGLDPRRWAYNVAYFSEALMVGRWMAARGHRHLHVHLASQPATVGVFVKCVFGCGLSITAHGPDEFYDVAGQHLAAKVAAADFICCISNYTASQLMRLAPHEQWAKLVVCRLGVDPQVFRPPPTRRASATFRVLCVGRLTPAKGQHLLIDAVVQIGRSGGDIHLHVVGAGVDRPSLDRHVARLGAERWVTFAGAVNQDHIRALYAEADCFCLPSFAEGIPVVLMEAMAMGIACVTTHVSGIPELIRDRLDGLLVAPADVAALVAALQSLLDDPQLRLRLAASGRERVLERFDLAANVAALGAVFTARLAQPPP